MHTYKNMMTKLLTCLIVMGLLNATPAFAEQDKASKRAAIIMRKMQVDMQAQIDQQMAIVEQQKAEIVKQQLTIDELTEYKDKANNLASAKNSLTKQNESLAAKQKETVNALDTANATNEELTTKLKSTSDALAFSEGQRKTILSNLTESNQALSTCETKNKQLYAYGSELIDFYESPKAVKAIENKKSFLQNKRVVLDNLLQAQQDALDENRFEVR
jgi:chromosome segregation ATPase